MSLEAETRAILEAAGAEKIKVAQDALGFVVAATFTGKGFDGQPHSGHTGLDPNTSSDPRDLARRLIEISRREHDRRAGVKPEPQRDAWEEPATTLTEEPTFAPDKDPFGPPPEPLELGAEILAAEAESETQADNDQAGEAADAGSVVGSVDREDGGRGIAVRTDDVSAEGDDDEQRAEAVAEKDVIDAEFSDLPALEGQDVAEEPADAGGGVAYFGDNLHVIRLAKIGRLSQIAATKKPAVSNTRLAELRNFAMGVSEGRWPNNEENQQALSDMEAAVSLASAIGEHCDKGILFLNAASREEVEAFDPEAGWP